MLINWEMYLPEAFVYRTLSSQDISIDQKASWDSRHIFYTYKTVVAAKYNTYLFQQVINRLIQFPRLECQRIIHNIFPKLMDDHRAFIYQWRIVNKSMKRIDLSQQVDNLLLSWKLDFKAIETSDITEKEARRIVIDDYRVIKSFDHCLSANIAEVYSQMINFTRPNTYKFNF